MYVAVQVSYPLYFHIPMKFEFSRHVFGKLSNIKFHENPPSGNRVPNRVLRSVFVPKRDKVTRERRKLHNEELSDLYSLPNIVRMVRSRRMRLAGHVMRMGEGRGVHRVLVGKPEGKRPLGRPRSKWDNNIKMDLQEVGGGCGDWMELARDREGWPALVSTVMNLRVPQMRGIS